jgi:hypothetical protein
MPIIAYTNPVSTEIAKTPIFAVDLGFSESDPSVGFAYGQGTEIIAGEKIFGDCIAEINSWLQKQKNKCVLIVESPLTMALTAHGNPCHRQIELQRNYQRGRAPRSPKGWYYQAGANLSLGSSVFLQRLIVPQNLTVELIEGFYCSISPDERHADHREVAQHLMQRLYSLAGSELVVPQAETEGGAVYLLPGLEGSIGGIPPVLLRDGLEFRDSRE